MRLCSFDAGDGPRTGLVRNRSLIDLHAADAAIPADMLRLLQDWDTAKPRLDAFADACVMPAVLRKVDQVRMLPPVPTPGRYLDFYSFEGHVRNARAKRGLDVVPEWYACPTYYNGNPYCFVGDGAAVRYPADETQRDYEMELAVVIARPVRDLSPDGDAWRQAIAGFTILNDCSARGRQMPYAKVGMGPSHGKDFGKALGPYVVTPDECPDPTRIELATTVNGEEWSRGPFGEAHYDWADMLAFATKDQDLRPGDVVGSGTFTNGCGYELGRFLSPGDVVAMTMRYDGRDLMTLRTVVA